MQLTLLLRNIPFEVERILCSRLNSFLRRRPSSAPFLSGDTYRAMADFVFDETGGFDPTKVGRGDIVFVGARRLDEFVDEVLPAIGEGFVLVTHQGDRNVDEGLGRVAEHPMVLHWFAQNCMLEHPKVTPLPIGLEDRWRHNNGDYGDFRRIGRKNSPSIPMIAHAFTLGTNLDKRIECYRALKSSRVGKELPQPINSSLYREMVKRYMLVASPPGNGLDCHRTWEAMYMGCVPVVEDDYMNRRFAEAGAPMVLVRSWDEIREWDEGEVRARYARAAGSLGAPILFADHWRRAFSRAR